MNAAWRFDRMRPLAGRPGLLAVLDQEDGPEGRTVCVIPGHVAWHVAGGTSLRLLDEQDVANARLIAAAPQMHSVLAALAGWAARMGGWDADCWDDAHALLARLREPDAAA